MTVTGALSSSVACGGAPAPTSPLPPASPSVPWQRPPSRWNIPILPPPCPVQHLTSVGLVSKGASV